MYLELYCPGCREFHPVGNFGYTAVLENLHDAQRKTMMPQMLTRFSESEWEKILRAEILRRIVPYKHP